MLRCRDIVRHGDAFLSGDMRGWRRVGFWMHLLFCRYCRRYIRQLRTTQAVSVALAPAEMPSDDVVDAILARLAEGTATPMPEKNQGSD